MFVVMYIALVVLVLLGVVMVLSASASVSVTNSDSVWSYFRGQTVYAALGLALMSIAIFVDYHKLRVLARFFIVMAGLLMVAVLLPGFGLRFNGATRWLNVGPVTLQPSEVAKFALILFVADLLSRPGREIRNTRATIRPVVVVTGIFMVLLVVQPHLGAIVVVGTIVGMMMFLAGAPLAHMVGLAASGVLLAGAMVSFTSWRRARFLAFLDPWSDPTATGYQQLQSLHAITVGGLDGVGLGESRAKWGFLPYAHSDFIFAIIAEELGLIGAAIVISGYAVIAVTGFTAAVRAPDRFGMLLAVGITTWITVQALINLGGVLVLMPVIGVTLPFLSFGGSSLVVTLTATGVLLNIAGQGNKPKRVVKRDTNSSGGVRRIR